MTTRALALAGFPLDLDSVEQALGCHVEHVDDHEVSLRFGTFAFHGSVRGGRLLDFALHAPLERASVAEPARLRVARALLALGMGFGVSWVDLAGGPDLTDELAIHAWLELPPPPTAQEAFDIVSRQVATDVTSEVELLARAYGHPEAHVLMERLAAKAPHWGTLPEPGARSDVALLRVTYTFDAYKWVGPIGGYANRIHSNFRKTGTLPHSPAAARVCLFFEARRRVHTGSDPTAEDWRYYDALLDVLRTASGVLAQG